MGCTPSKSAVIYTQDRICRDLDTCSTFVPSLKSSVSTPERPRLCLETSSGRQTFLSVPCRDVHGRSVSQSSYPESWSSAGSVSPGSSSCVDQGSMNPRSPTPDLHGDTEGCGTA
ncbi:uncharacterized protein AKAME5_002293600 [Lates japonicus]|uniref:Uncharacterized protein n=1 Tax=Lates japonicus TaxID=270547 RepID=A0AAD3RK81_LATJO|nr:uncharacterized protein AKAME5_002293400 [Lates japonicus]GLD71614.1 uncharacterized protein AKAME5_002293600 [Lates japonicus]